MERITPENLDPSSWTPQQQDSDNSGSKEPEWKSARRTILVEMLLGEIFLKASQVPPRGEGMISMVDMALDSWRDIPDARLREFTERAIVKSAPFAASIALVAKLHKDRNKDEHGHPVHDELAAVRANNATMAAAPMPLLTDPNSRPISEMPRELYLAQCAELYRRAGLPVPPHLLSPG